MERSTMASPQDSPRPAEGSSTADGDGTRGRLILTDATVIDGRGGKPLERASILIEGRRIRGVESSAESFGTQQPGDRVVNLSGRYVIPGLFNLHEHIYRKNMLKVRPGWHYDDVSRALEGENDNYLVVWAARHALDYLRAGVTTIRCIGERSDLVVSLRRAIDQGLVVGPRLQVAVKLIVMTGGHGHYIGREADGPAEIRKATREQLRAGADFIKIIATGGLLGMPKESPGNPQLTVEEIRAATEVAHRAGKLTTAHADATQGIQNAVQGGIDCIEHGAFLDDRTIEMMLEHDVSLVPTLSGLRGYADWQRRAGNAQLADFIDREVNAKHVESFQKARAAGVRIGVGSDTPAITIDEIEDLNRAGMPPDECLLAATSTAAKIAGLGGNLGTIEADKFADLVVLAEDPNRDVQALRAIEMVIKDGTSVPLTGPVL